MPRKDADALAVWDARARTLIGRLDAVLETSTATHEDPVAPHTAAGPTAVAPDPRLGRLARRAAASQPPPPGEIVYPEPMGGDAWRRDPAPRAARPNMGPQEERIDHWDAYVCRFDEGEGHAGPARPAP